MKKETIKEYTILYQYLLQLKEPTYIFLIQILQHLSPSMWWENYIQPVLRDEKFLHEVAPRTGQPFLVKNTVLDLLSSGHYEIWRKFEDSGIMGSVEAWDLGTYHSRSFRVLAVSFFTGKRKVIY